MGYTCDRVDSSMLLIPLCANVSMVAVELDKNAVVQAKTYSAMSTTDLGVAHITAIRRVREMMTPPGKWQADMATISSSLMLPIPTDEDNLAAILLSCYLSIVPYYLYVTYGPFPGQPAEQYPGLFDGLGEEGFFLDHRSLNGWRTTIRNIGGGRIRIETSTFRIGPPLWPLWVVLVGSLEDGGVLQGPGELRVNGKVILPVQRPKPPTSQPATKP